MSAPQGPALCPECSTAFDPYWLCRRREALRQAAGERPDPYAYAYPVVTCSSECAVVRANRHSAVSRRRRRSK